jgi:DNA-binding MarR family transcriptional regulator
MTFHPTDILDQYLIATAWTPDPQPGDMASDSDDALTWLAPHLGPTSCLVLHRISRYLTTSDTFSIEYTELARTFGVAPSQLKKNIERLCQFGHARRNGDTLEVATTFRLTPRNVQKLPEYLRADYPGARS